MSRTGPRRLLLACTSFSTLVDLSLVSRSRSNGLNLRSFSRTCRRPSDDKHLPDASPVATTTSQSAGPNPTTQSSISASSTSTPVIDTRNDSESSSAPLSKLSRLFGDTQRDRQAKNRGSFLDVKGLSSIGDVAAAAATDRYEEPHHLHVYAHKHNTHITLTRPNRDPMLSVSCGNIGFKHAGRKHYDSAFQLAAYAMGRIQEQGWNSDIKKLEVSLRGWGTGREAVTKALLGVEGKFLRGKVVKVTDATRLKFGGTRSKKPRRLG